MIVQLDGGLNLNDSKYIPDRMVAVAENVDFRKRGVVRTRDGSAILYSGVGTPVWIEESGGSLYSFSSDIYKDGVSLSNSISGLSAVGKAQLMNTTTEVILFADDSGNWKVEGASVYPWGIAAPSVAPSLAENGAGAISGSYYFVYTYVREVSGTVVAESNRSPESSQISVTSKQIQVTCTAPLDTQVTHIYVYRTFNNAVTGGDEFYYDFSITLPTAAGTTNNTDGLLGAIIDIENDAPPSTTINSIAGPSVFGTVFIAHGNKISFSREGRPESIPSDYFVTVGSTNETVLTLIDWDGVIFAMTNDGIYRLQGNDPDTYVAVRTRASRGIAAKDAWVLSDLGVLYLALDGIRLFNGSSDSSITEGLLDPIFRGEEVNGVQPLNKDGISTCRMEYFNNKVYMIYPSGVNTTPDKVLVLELGEKKWSIYDYGRVHRSIYNDVENFRLLAGGADGRIWRLETGDNDNGSAFSFTVRSKDLNGMDVLSASEFRVDFSNPSLQSLTFDWLSDEVSVYLSTISDSGSKKRRKLPPLSAGDVQLEIRGSVTGRVEIGTVEVA